jgi:predicted AAA+ superfamily ATPase
MDDTDHPLISRFSAELVATALKDTPVVMVTGPRQCGKTTLVRDLVAGNREFITMDDDTVLAAARSDPTGLVRALDRTTIDEVQRVPDLLRAIKKSVDDDRRAGRFLLTGSANILILPQVSESLAGRMEIVSLLPLSRAEIRGKKPGFLKAAFDSKLGKPEELMIGKDLSTSRADWRLPRNAAARRSKATPDMGAGLHKSHRAAGCTRSCRRGKA